MDILESSIDCYWAKVGELTMPQRIHLSGGPHAGLVLGGTPNSIIGLPVDQSYRPTETSNPLICALYQVGAEDPGTEYAFAGFQRTDHQPLPMEFIDGPFAGVHDIPQVGPEVYVPLISDHTLFRGVGNPAAVAIYTLTELGGKWCYRLSRIDDSPRAVGDAIAGVNEQRLAIAIRNFYLSPDYDIYSMKPTGDHTQVPVQVGWRRGHVDEGIAELISETWRLGLDTVGSCQSRPAGDKFAGMAYVGFFRCTDAECFHDWLVAAGIQSTLKEVKGSIARTAGPDGRTEEIIEYTNANVLFAPSCIDQISALVRQKTPIRP
jgi:hypothetical protein